MSDLIGNSKPVKQQNDVGAIRQKYRTALKSDKYKNLSNVPPHLQPHAKRFIDGKSKGLGTSHNANSITTKYPPEMDNALRALDNRSDYIRRAVLEKLHKDGILLDYTLPDLS